MGDGGKPTYTYQLAAHFKLLRGGFSYLYEVRREGSPIGIFTVTRETRAGPTIERWYLDDEEFPTARQFLQAARAKFGDLGP